MTSYYDAFWLTFDIIFVLWYLLERTLPKEDSNKKYRRVKTQRRRRGKLTNTFAMISCTNYVVFFVVVEKSVPLKSKTKLNIASLQASMEARCQQVKHVFKSRIPRSKLLPAKFRRTNDVHDEKRPEICRLDGSSQASNSTQLASDTPKAIAAAKGKLSPISKSSEVRDGMPQRPALREAIKAPLKDDPAESQAPVGAKFQHVKHVFKIRIPKSQLSPAKFQQANDAHEAKASTVPTLDVNCQNPQSASDAPKATSATSKSSKLGDGMPSKSTLRGALKTSVKDTFAESRTTAGSKFQKIKHVFESRIPRSKLSAKFRRTSDVHETKKPMVRGLNFNSRTSNNPLLTTDACKAATTRNQGTPKDTVSRLGFLRSRCSPAPSNSIKESETPKTESQKMRLFRGNDTTRSKSLKFHLHPASNVSPNPPSNLNTVSGNSFNYPNVKSPATVSTNKSAAGQSLPLKSHRSLGFMAPTKSSAARANTPTHGILKSTSGTLSQSKFLDNDTAGPKSVISKLPNNSSKLSTSNSKEGIKPLFKNTFDASRASVRAKIHPVKGVFKSRTPISQLLPAEFQRTNDAHEAKMSTTSALEIDHQDNNNSQLVSDASKNASTNVVLSSISKSGKLRDGMSSTLTVRQSIRTSVKDALAAPQASVHAKCQQIKDGFKSRIPRLKLLPNKFQRTINAHEAKMFTIPTSDVNCQANNNPRVVSYTNRATSINRTLSPIPECDELVEDVPSKLTLTGGKRASVKDALVESQVSTKTKCQRIKDGFRSCIPRSKLLPAKFQRTSDIHMVKLPTTPALDVNRQASKIPQLASDAPKATSIKRIFSSTSKSGKLKDGMQSKSTLRGALKTSVKDTFAATRVSTKATFRPVKNLFKRRTPRL